MSHLRRCGITPTDASLLVAKKLARGGAPTGRIRLTFYEKYQDVSREI
jgi:hypothetical protein